jgi:hypothetical protein
VQEAAWPRHESRRADQQFSDSAKIARIMTFDVNSR